MSSDPNSLANVDEVATKHININWNVDFDQHQLIGFVELTVEALKDGVHRVVVDTRDLTVKSAESTAGKQLKLEKTVHHDVFGTAYAVELPSALNKGATDTVRIHYHTAPQSTAIQWLKPSQTADKQHPYLFTQCQAIHARSMLPCQDSPTVKATYSASVTVPAALTAVMSANGTGSTSSDGKTKTFTFKQDVPMTSYLIALGVGALEHRQIGPRTKVWSEKSMVDAGAFEFSQTEEFLQIAEKLVGKYVWGNYDVLLLPPSFPYGGMENPCLTFVTPTLLAGDRSNADVIAHEISHSWTGNLVTNRTWEHFWLNEGFTVYLERAIYAEMYGQPTRHFKSIIGYKSLQDSVESFGATNPLTNLIPDLKGIDPDDAFSSVPYEKGYNFLFYLENLVGGYPVFVKFVHDYIDHFKYQSITSEDFKSFFLNYFQGKVDLSAVDWNKWFFQPGMPPVESKFDTTMTSESENLAKKWVEYNTNSAAFTPSEADIKSWSAGQIVVFLDKLVTAANPLSIATLDKIDEVYKLNSSRNAEIRFRWYSLCIRSENSKVFPNVAAFLKEQGRMKYVRPLYRSLFKSQTGKQVALDTFLPNRDIYHNIASKMIAKDLEVPEN
eukprot:CAMPEP_0168552066 /NCGR_PEP_ID=MMETSP0413-20121227/6519_1 /TAXON_ID=136452 /ORGANISM="Filamoeba nolandi, Strain NC-AS-23-1" /LENGTH=610 /DNA_ID=CAMNT_0008582657 /DNA_START=35 /DNA_END=1867 /DNA_ORIENTATION=-